MVVKCLKLGAADYLVKPLRTNELLNLWTHMWRRRRMVCFFSIFSSLYAVNCHIPCYMIERVCVCVCFGS